MSDLLLQDLKDAIAEGKAVFVIGSGVSTGATNRAPVASWQGLLIHGVQRSKELDPSLNDHWQNSTIQRANVDMISMLGVAEEISERLGYPDGGEYSRWLRETVGQLKVEEGKGDVLEALRDLNVPLATTNYDSLIEKVTGWPPVMWRDTAQMERVLRGDAKGVLHLHGHWNQPDSVVLGIRSYDAVMGHEHAQTVLKSLQMMKTLVFVGFGAGLEDPNFGRLLEWTGKVFAGSEYRRFRLAKEDEVTSLQAKHPPEQRLFVLSYGSDHPDLAPFLQSLKPAPKATPSPTPPPIPTAPGAKLPGIGKSTVLTFALRKHSDVAARFGERRYQVSCDAYPDPSALWALSPWRSICRLRRLAPISK